MFTAVKLTGCTVPKGKSYITALRDQNILVRDKLELIGLPYDVNFSKKSLAGLPTTVNYLHVSAKRGILVPERDTFAGLDQIQTLHLASVRPERLPKKVQRLVLEGAGYDVIPAEAMNAVEIKLSQLNPISLAGIAPRLETMNLTGPVTDLPFAPALETLILNGNRRGKMPVPTGLGSNCSSLVRLELRGLGWTELPKGLLREAKSLYYFVAVQNKFETLNVGVFDYDLPELSEMDLSGNGLIDLPNNLFSKLLGLNVVILDNNKLTARALRSLTPLTSLTHLHLSGNPLGDLCLPGGLSILPGAQFLQELHLSHTNATQVCLDYLLESRDLTWVDLSHNAIRSLSCDQLYVRRDYLSKPLHVELTSNPIATINCTKDDYETAAIQPAYPQRADIVMDSALRCDCASYWLSEWVQLKVSVTLNPKYKGPCERKWTACKEETVHLIEQPIPLNYYPQKIYMQTCRTPEALANHKFKPKDHPIYYETVYLNHCNVDLTESLSDALRAVNVTLDKSLYLSDIPSTSRLTVAATSNLPETLASLVISVSEGVMEVEPGALADLNTVGRLSLMRVRADRLPSHLDYLSLTDTGNCSLPDRALNAIQIMINEDISVSMAGSAPRLRELTVSAPSVVLPDAPVLEKISLHYMKILLVGLFADTPALKEIDLSSNEIQSIPRWLFDGLNYLERLTLMNNNLITADVTILGTITSLKKLDLRRNPIGDLCDSASEPSPLKSLKELQILDLSTTNLTHTCSDWIDGLPALRWLHVSHNAIETAPCMALHATRDPKVFQPIIDLTGNPIGGFDCSKEDYRRPVKMASNQMVSLWTDEPLKCNCSNYWLVKILVESKNTVLYKPRFGNGICTVDMLRYC